MKQNYIVFKNKNSLLSCILLAITAGIVMMGISVVLSINHDWQNWNNNDVNFRTYDLANSIDEEEILKLENLKEVDKIVSPKEYGILASNTFLEDDPTSNLYLEGIPLSEIEKILDKDVKDFANKNFIICSNKFKPRNATVFYNNIDYIDLSDMVGQNIKLNFNNKNEELLLVGLYNNELFYGDDDVCFSSYDVVKNLNEKYGSNDNGKYHLVANKTFSSKNVVNVLKENGYNVSNINSINSDKKDTIISYAFWLTVVIGLFTFFGTYLFIIRKINKYRKDEIFMQGLIAYALAIVISFTGFLIIENYFLANNTLFNKMDMTYSYIALIVGVLITFVTPISANIAMKKKLK